MYVLAKGNREPIASNQRGILERIEIAVACLWPAYVRTSTESNIWAVDLARLTFRMYLQAAAGYVLHIGTLDGSLKVGDKVHAAIDHERRDKIMSNHTSTHVLNHALRELLGEHINQSGSAVDEDRLRFDFTHPKKLEPQEVRASPQTFSFLQ